LIVNYSNNSRLIAIHVVRITRPAAYNFQRILLRVSACPSPIPLVGITRACELLPTMGRRVFYCFCTGAKYYRSWPPVVLFVILLGSEDYVANQRPFSFLLSGSPTQWLINNGNDVLRFRFTISPSGGPQLARRVFCCAHVNQFIDRQNHAVIEINYSEQFLLTNIHVRPRLSQSPAVFEPAPAVTGEPPRKHGGHFWAHRCCHSPTRY
jgi:hypothetical protein